MNNVIKSDDFIWQVRHQVYRHFGLSGQAPSLDWLVETLAAAPDQVEEALLILAKQHHALALAPGSTQVQMAWPFSATPTPYPVRTAECNYWANCAWDALSLPTLLGVDAASTYHCADCGEPIDVRIEGGELAPCDALVHIVVPPRRFHEDVIYT